jgi:hypothetical protein
LAGQEFTVMQINQASAAFTGIDGSLQCLTVVGFSISFSAEFNNIIDGSGRLAWAAGATAGTCRQFAADGQLQRQEWKEE